jgi:hypothetical protein
MSMHLESRGRIPYRSERCMGKLERVKANSIERAKTMNKNDILRSNFIAVVKITFRFSRRIIYFKPARTRK